MPEIQTGQDGSFEDQAAVAEESARVDAARAELYDEAAGQEQPAQGDELILGKYRSVDDLASAYQSLQAEYTRLKGGQPEPAPEPSQEAPEAAQEEQPDNRQEQPKLTVQDAERIRDQMFDQVGGEERYKAVAGWAARNLPPDRIGAFNAALEQGDQSQVINQLKGLQYDYMMATGYEPRLTGGRAPSNQTKGFSSEAQVIEAMKDPRYSGSNPDPAYIKEVEQRIAVSNVFTPK